MKHFTIYLFALLLIVNYSRAQNKAPKVKYGAVTIQELKSKACNYAADAKAELLISKGVLDITTEHISYYVHKRFKVYSSEGKEYATVEIPLYAPKGDSKQTIRNLKASCFNLENGQIVETKLKKEDKFEKRKSDNYKEISFVIPNVKVGSVFEYTYRIESEYFSSIPSWQLHFDIPVLQNIFDYEIDQAFLYKVYFTGNVYDAETGKTGKDNWGFDSRKGSLYSVNNLPIYKEPYQPNMSDVYGKVNFQLVRHVPSFTDYSSDYNALNKSLLKSDYFGSGLGKKGILKALYLTKKTPDEAFAKDIFKRLKGKVSWNGYYGTYSEDYGKKLITTLKEGTVSDINLTLVTALKEAGFDAAPILASTRGNGTPHPVFADLKRFNYVIAGIKMPTGWFFLDATSPLPYGEIPLKLLNGNGYIVHKTLNGWYNLKEGRKATKSIFIQAAIKGNVYTENVSIKYNKHLAYPKIEQIKEEGIDAFEEDFISNYEKEISGFTVSYADYEQPLVVKFTTSQVIEDADILYMEPVSYNGSKKNPFEREKRFSNLNFPYSFGEKIIYKLTIDENWQVEPIKSQRYAMEDKKGTFNYLFSNNTNTIDVVSDFTLNETFYTVEEYSVLKQFFEGYSTLQNELLVVKRKL